MMKQLILAVTFLLAAGVPAHGQVVAYRALGANTDEIVPIGKPVPVLPEELVIPPGQYVWEGNLYNLEQPGLYRFLLMGKRQEQRIVDTGDVHALLSSLAWLHVHGTADDNLSPDALEKEAMRRKVVSSCGAIAGMAMRYLTARKTTARMVATLAAPPYNTYDNGHTIFEVFRSDLGRWVAYDLDNNAYYEWEGIQLSVAELAERSVSGEYKVVPLATDSTGAGRQPDVKFDYTFYYDHISGSEAALRKWLARVARVALINDGGIFYFTTDDDEMRKAAEKYSRAYRYLPPEEFAARFYAPPVIPDQGEQGAK